MILQEFIHQAGFKFKYGAWYLDPKIWAKRRADEPLVDPNSVASTDKLLSEAEKEKVTIYPTNFCNLMAGLFI